MSRPRYNPVVRRGLAVLGLLLACGKGGKDGPPAPAPGPEAGPVEPTPPPAPAPPADPEPLGADPLYLEDGPDGPELRGFGLPAIADDGKHVARVQRRWKGALVVRQALFIEEVGGKQREEIAVWDAARDQKTPRDKLEQRVTAANARLARGSWRSLVAAEAVFPDGWIRCDIEQRFEVGGFAVIWRAPRLKVTDRKQRAVIDQDRNTWVAKPGPGDCGGTYLGGAWVDPRGLMVIEVQYCGACDVPPLTVLERWEPT